MLFLAGDFPIFLLCRISLQVIAPQQALASQVGGQREPGSESGAG